MIPSRTSMLMALAVAAAPGLLATPRGSNPGVATRSRPPINPRLNRSNKWPFARTYQEARDRSPFPERPVR